MWQRFTERARRVVFFSQEEAGRLGENYVSTEHLLLGLVRENDSVAARILDRLGVSCDTVRSEVERQVTRGDGRLGQDMQLTPRAKRVVDLAYDEARLLNNNYIGTEHLLLGLIREGEGLAGRVLAQVGVQLGPVREALKELQSQATRSEQTAEKKIVLPFAKKKRKGPGAAPDDVPAPEPVEPLPQKGDLGVLQDENGRQEAELILNEEAVTEFLDVLATKDP